MNQSTDQTIISHDIKLESLNLSEELLKNIELSEQPLTNLALKTSRLARILNDFKFQQIMINEVSGYPITPDGVTPEVWDLAVLANRKYEVKDEKTGKVNAYVYCESIAQLEEQVRIGECSLESARDPNISISSANPYQNVSTPLGNIYERNRLRLEIKNAASKLATTRTLIYQYVLKRFYELKYSELACDIFTSVRKRVDHLIGQTVPGATQKFVSIHENLVSNNSEDWSNAVHSCRRILNDVADALFPPQREPIIKTIDGKEKEILLGKDQYINRLIAFVESKNNSERFVEIVGSHLNYLGERLDSIHRATTKGSHKTITTKEEADRYVIYTYLIVGDILSLLESK